jgi:hypothetical protein
MVASQIAKSISVGPEGSSIASDQLDIYGRRIPDELRWRAELAFLESGLRPGDLTHALKRFEEELSKLSALAQTQPALAMERLAALQAEMTRVFESFDKRWGQTLTVLQVERAALVKDLEAMRASLDATIERERSALYAAISAERAALATDATRIGKELGPLLLDRLGEIVNEALLLLCLLVLLLIGLPFLSGFIAGRMMTRRSQAAPSANRKALATADDAAETGPAGADARCSVRLRRAAAESSRGKEQRTGRCGLSGCPRQALGDRGAARGHPRRAVAREPRFPAGRMARGGLGRP